MRDGDAKEALLAAVDLALTTPVAARNRAVRWSDATCAEYLTQVGRARDWWSAEQRGARDSAERAGLTGIPAADAASFMPWSPDRLVRYVQHLCELDLAVATIRKALTALKAWHRLHGLPVPDGLPASEALQVHDTSRRAAGRGPKHAEPVTTDAALRLLAVCARDPKPLRGTRDAALIALTIAGMATPAQLVALNRRDVELAGEQGLRIRPAAAGGVWVEVLHWYAGDQHEPALCAVEPLAAWCAYLDSRDVDGAAPLLRGVDQHGNVSGLGAFAGHVAGDGRLDDWTCGNILRRVAAAAGVTPAPTMTELRLGGIVRRRRDGAPVAELVEQSGVASLLRYVIIAETPAPADT